MYVKTVQKLCMILNQISQQVLRMGSMEKSLSLTMSSSSTSRLLLSAHKAPPWVLPQVYLELGECPHCTACLNGDSQHGAPPRPKLTIWPSPLHKTHAQQHATECTDVGSKYSHARVHMETVFHSLFFLVIVKFLCIAIVYIQ